MEHDGAGWISHGLLAFVLLALLAALWRSGFLGRISKLIEQMMLGNWQLALLGAAAIALSLASGYTTFDGLRNFTSAPLLSLLVAFGIQGVMLIVSWLIGETFAAGMGRQAAPRSSAVSARDAALGTSLGAVLVGLAFCWALRRYDAIAFVSGPGLVHSFRADWQRVAEVALYFLTILTVTGLIVLVLRRGGDIVQPYLQSVRLIVKNAGLWVMLLACMAASVFFSLDSHFNAIFPAEQRRRAAEIRTLNQVAAVLADIGERAQKVQAAEAARLFETEGWKSYDARLSALALAARGTQAETQAFLVARMEERQRGIGEQQERIAAAERSQSALLRKRDELEAELQRVEVSIGALEAELARSQATHDETQQAIAAKEIEASAEDGGVEGTLKRGKGPIWRQRMAEIDELQRKLKVADEPRLKEAQRRRDAASARIVSLRREMATVIAEAAKYKGAISAAEHRIKAAQLADSEGARIEPAHMLRAFERARAAFRQRPEASRLAGLQAQCESLLGAVSGVAAAGQSVRGIDCDSRAAAEAAARLFALDAGLVAFRAGCAGGARLPQAAGTDELLAFGRKCLQDSGLISRDSADFGARLQAIEMNRDDKAHRFVVTWNSLLDGNRLGYLALTLAIGVDSLVFMAGLFGAAAARSPLSDVPGPRARSAERLEAMIRSALGEHRLETAELVLAAMRPAPGDEDQRSEVDLAGYDGARAERIRKVLVAGRSMGAVERAHSPADAERYLVRPELIEFLSAVVDRTRESERERSSHARLAQIVGVALEPDRPGNAAIVLRHAEPIEARRGFVARVDLSAVAREKERRLVQGVLSAGMTVSAVARDRSTRGLWRWAARTADWPAVYHVSAELLETLLHYRASAPAMPAIRTEARLLPLPAVDAPPEYASFEAVAAPRIPRDRLLVDGRAASELSRERDEDELCRQLRQALLKEVASEARAAIANLDHRPEAQRDRRSGLERIVRDSTRALQRAARALAREHKGDERAAELLHETCQQTARNIPALLLHLLEDLIVEAERSGDDDLLIRLSGLRSDIATMDSG